MQKFLFNLCGVADLFDEEGKELPDLAAAIQVARSAAFDIMSSDVKDGKLNLNYRIEVTSELGQIVHVVCFRDLVEVSGLRVR